jgi:hypothetical protein
VAVFLSVFSAIAFTWCSVTQRRSAFRRTGITARVVPGQVSRDKFVHVQQAVDNEEAQRDQSREEVDRNHDTRFVVQSPAGVEKGTAEYWKAKYQGAERVKCNLQETPILPADCKVLQVPKKAIEPASRTAVESKQGSFYFRNLVPDAQKRKDDKEEETERKKQRKEDASDRKSAKEAAQEAAVELWESENEHLAFCVCWVPGAKALYKCATKHLCGQCLEVKSCVCRAKKCKDGDRTGTMDSDSPTQI